MNFHELERFYNLGNYEELLDKISQTEDDFEYSNLSKHEQYALQLLKIKSMLFLGNIKTAYKLISAIDKNYSNININVKKLEIITYKLKCLVQLGKVEEAIALSQTTDNTFGEVINQDFPEFPLILAGYFAIKGKICFFSAKIVEAEQNLRKGLEFSKLDRINTTNIDILTSLGNVMMQKNQPNKALEYYNQSLSKARLLNNPYLIFPPLNNIGKIYRRKGKLNQSSKLFHEILLLNEKINNPIAKMNTNFELGAINHQRGDLDQAIDFYQKALHLVELSTSKQGLESIYFHLIIVALDMNDQGLASNYWEEMKVLSSKIDSIYLNQGILLAEALILKSDTRARNKFKAQEILTGILSDVELNTLFKSLALTHQAELLLLELQVTDDLEVFIELKEIIKKIQEFSQNYDSTLVNVNLMLIIAKFKLIEGNLISVIDLLDKAYEIAERNDLEILKQKINKEKTLLDQDYEKWIVILQDNKNLSFKEKLEQAKILNYIKDAQKILGGMN